MTGPLQGLEVVELAGEGPVPHAAMLLADLGARVTRVVRPGPPGLQAPSPLHTHRGRVDLLADLKDPADRDRVRALAGTADVLLEGLRPGAAERLGLGPADLGSRRVVYARMTGWGQDGPLARTAGHDINYLAVTGALHAIGTPDQPLPPLNLVGDYGGGSTLLVVGILAALRERDRTGQGCVVDGSIVDGVINLMQPIWQSRSEGTWSDRRGANLLDGGTPWYRTYPCADGRHVALGALEPKFFGLVLQALDLDPAWVQRRENRAEWPELTELLEAAFAAHDRDHWTALFDGTDACVTPVLALDEVADHQHIAARGALQRVGSAVTSAAAPRFSPLPAPSAVASASGTDAAAPTITAETSSP